MGGASFAQVYFNGVVYPAPLAVNGDEVNAKATNDAFVPQLAGNGFAHLRNVGRVVFVGRKTGAKVYLPAGLVEKLVVSGDDVYRTRRGDAALYRRGGFLCTFDKCFYNTTHLLNF